MAVVLLTGARGFVGRQIAKGLVALGMETHALSSTEADLSIPAHAWHRVDLMDTSSTRALVEALRPTHLVHAAWDTTHGAFWTSDANYAWVRATLALMEAFQAAGGRRWIVVGSCAEYDWRFGFCSEDTTPLNPAQPYGVCKASLFRLSEAFAKSHDISMAWARLFLLYGPHERPQRLVPSIANALLAGRAAGCSRGDQLRDLMHVEDAGRAIARLSASDVSGAINIGSGHPIPLSSVGLEIGKQLGRPELVQLGALPTRPDDPPVLIPDTRRLHTELGFKPRFDLASGIADSIEFWRKQPIDRTS
ncbi:NAD-dependent epimerase/dehydratase family protein [Bradyrhizobium japonicum]|uniref:NAD-dependent epimerase/dehydratase family protein n=1 Tax=Bradyrhizobium japonicum TaxID=375 RepID=UPI0009B7CCB1|nr:NAD(P)-dependent oxidoreductase [Bradyrhizobium japonicum]